MGGDSWAEPSHLGEDESLIGDFQAKPTKYTEEPRSLTPEEITREVGECVPLNASLLIEQNSIPDLLIGLQGLVTYKGDRTLVYPPLLGLAKFSFFKDEDNEPPYFPPGFYCLFCRWNLNGGQWGKNMSDLPVSFSTCPLDGYAAATLKFTTSTKNNTSGTDGFSLEHWWSKAYSWRKLPTTKFEMLPPLANLTFTLLTLPLLLLKELLIKSKLPFTKPLPLLSLLALPLRPQPLRMLQVLAVSRNYSPPSWQ